MTAIPTARPLRPTPLLRHSCHLHRRHPTRSHANRAHPPPLPPPAATPFMSDPADWERVSPEWYGSQGGGWGRSAGRTVFSAASPVGNGAVTVTAHPASVAPQAEWRVLRFGEATRQSVALVDVLSGQQQAVKARPDALAFEYVKTVVASAVGALGRMPAGTLNAALSGEGGEGGDCRVLCIGVGGGSVPLALASLFPGATVTGVDLCPAVLAATDAMGLTAAAAATTPNLRLEEADGVAALAALPPESLDLLIVDAFDGADAVPASLATPGGAGLAAAAAALHPAHGAVVINLHAGPKPGPGDWLARGLGGGGQPAPPTFVVRPDGTGPGAAALATAQAWSKALLDGTAGAAWMVGVRRQANAVAVVVRGGGGDGGAQAASASATAAASKATMALPFDVGDRASYGYFEVDRRRQ